MSSDFRQRPRSGQALMEMALVLAMTLVIVFTTLALIPVLRIRGEVEAASHAATSRISMFQAPQGSSTGQQANWLCTSSLAVAEYQLAGVVSAGLTRPPGTGACSGSSGANGRLTVSVNHAGRRGRADIWRVCINYVYPTNIFVLTLTANGRGINREGLGTLIFNYCGQDEVDAFRTR